MNRLKAAFDKVKWLVAALGAAILVVLSVIYGKTTIGVMRSKLQAAEAKAKVLAHDLAIAEKKAEAETSDEAKKLHIAKAETIRTSQDELSKKREKLVGVVTGGLGKSDVELARARNRSSSAA